MIFCALVVIVGIYVGPTLLMTVLTEGLAAFLRKQGVKDKVVEEIVRKTRLGLGIEDVSGPIEGDIELSADATSRRILQQAIEISNSGNEQRVDEAIHLLKRAVNIDPRNWFAAYLVGALYLDKKQDAQQALKYSLIAIEADKHHYNQFMNAGVAYLWLNDYVEARTHLERAIKSIEGDGIARHLPQFVVQYGKCLIFIGESFSKENKRDKAIEYHHLALKKLTEIPEQYRDEAALHWIEQAKKRLRDLGEAEPV